MKKLFLILIGIIISSAMFGSSFIIPTKPVTAYNSIEEILKTIDPNILPHTPPGPTGGGGGGGTEPYTEGANTNGNFTQVLAQKATEIRNFIASKYYEDLSNLTDIDVIVLGIMLVPFERRELSQGFAPNQKAFDCMMTAVGAATGIGALVAAWNSGASVSTILSVLKSIIRISYGWFAVGYAVYSFGDCVGWW
jgi:hypothetical protein